MYLSITVSKYPSILVSTPPARCFLVYFLATLFPMKLPNKIKPAAVIPYFITLLALLFLTISILRARSNESVLTGFVTNLKSQISQYANREENQKSTIASLSAQLNDLLIQDQYLINQDLIKEQDNIRKTYRSAVDSYEKLLDLKAKVSKVEKLDALFAQSLKYLADRKYSSASATLADLNQKIKAETEKYTSTFKIPENITVANTPPGSGYRRQNVTVGDKNFMVDIISADLGSTKVIVDTASDSDCKNDCPVLPLATYVSRSGAYAGINGSYFCPASYPSCADKKNSFDLLVMNKNKKYLNSDNNVYSTNPAAIFTAGSARFVSQAMEWGRDTGVDGVISNYPLLLLNGEVKFGGNSDEKQSSKGNRSFVGASGSTVYIGVVFNATVAESAQALKALGLNHALNLDNGGSTALWSGGYKAGPGRDLPNVILFVRR